tara:strand:+ start:1677 stop:2330 length:654 start_codon:yes stop_codon:yes gene_type:complete
MPYCKKANTLWIHIPKTGGTSIYIYFLNKYSKKEVTLFSGIRNTILPEEHLKKISLQHQTYETLIKYKELLNIDCNNNTKIFTVVRNPYHRIISDLFSYGIISKKSTPEEVFECIKTKYLYNDNLDNHNIPQYLFVCDKNGILFPEISIFKTESLKKELIDYGFKDFNIRFGSIKSKDISVEKEEYINYLNKNSILLINDFYNKDFELFNYKKIEFK